MSENPQSLIDRYRRDPVAFAREFFGPGFKVDPWQEELLRVVMGVDWASGPDTTVFVSIHADGPEPVYVWGDDWGVFADEAFGAPPRLDLELRDGVWQLPR